MHRAYSFIEIKSADAELREISGIATTPSLDASGDIVEPLGAEFKLPIPLLWQHRADLPIGHVIEAKATAKGITFRAKIAKIVEPGRLKDRLDDCWQSLTAGLVRALSIGFVPKDYEALPSGGLRFTRWNWAELSAVTIPCNSDCTIQTVKALDTQARIAARGPVHIVRLSDPISRKAGLPAVTRREPIRLSQGEIDSARARVAEAVDGTFQTHLADQRKKASYGSHHLPMAATMGVAAGLRTLAEDVDELWQRMGGRM